VVVVVVVVVILAGDLLSTAKIIAAIAMANNKVAKTQHIIHIESHRENNYSINYFIFS